MWPNAPLPSTRACWTGTDLVPRLLNVNNYHYRRGGAEVVYLEHGEMFARQGWDIDWFSMRHPSNVPGTDERHFAELIDLEHMSGKVAKLRAAAAIVWNTDAQRKISALVDARRPDVAHLHNIYHHLSPSVLVALKRRGVPTVLTAHDLKLACPNYKMLSHGRVCERCRGGRVWNVATHTCMKGSAALSGLIALESAVHKSMRLYARNIDRIVAPSRFYRNKLIAWGWPEAQVTYIPNFATTHFAPTPVPAAGGLLYFGRLSEEKGVATLIRAAAMSGVAVTIAGTGPAEAALHALAAEMRAPVAFAGYRAGAALGALLSASRAIVLPSEWYENAPMSVLESFSAGRPALGARIGGIPELIAGTGMGWTFESGSVTDLAEKMAMVADLSVDQLNDMGRAAATFVQREMNPAVYFDQMQQLYKSL